MLAGDLFSLPEANKRGGFGDVGLVWRAFAERFRWVAGVLGNHDDLGADSSGSKLSRHGRVHVLDGDVVELDGLRVGGVGLISGNPARRGRRAEADQLALIELTAELAPELLVLHEGPSGGSTQPGHSAVRDIVEGARVPLTVCGHEHWDHPLAEHATGQMLNVDTRVLILERADR